jgi:hypothetical protein
MEVPQVDRTAAQTLVERTAQRFEFQAAACQALGSSLYAGLLNQTAADLRAGGPAVAVLDGHLAAPGRGALALRMLGGIHALVLTGRAPELAKFYPSVGGQADPGPNAELAWPAMRRVLIEHQDEVRSWLGHPPQTNEVGRGAALVGALCRLAAEASYPIRLVEIGASAGLNLRADKFRITGADVAYGESSSPVQIIDGWLGDVPAVRPIEVVSRVGGDLAPVDPVSDSGRLRLIAYVWADQVKRLDRLRGACQLAAEVPAEMRTEPASETIGGTTLEPGTWTVLWHSIMRQYLSEEQKDAVDEGIEALGAQATTSARFAHVSLELVRGTADTPVDVVTWPGRVSRRLGSAPPHGVPVTWSS